MTGPNGPPDYSTDILGTYFYRTGIAGQHPIGIPDMGLGATISTITFIVLLVGVILIQTLSRDPQEGTKMSTAPRIKTIIRPGDWPGYVLLGFWSLLVLIPFWVMVVNSFKPSLDIFRNPLSFPTTFFAGGYEALFVEGNFLTYFLNSLIITTVSILAILVLSATASFGLANWVSRTSRYLLLFFLAGLMIPIRIASINLLGLVKDLGLMDTLAGCFPSTWRWAFLWGCLS